MTSGGPHFSLVRVVCGVVIEKDGKYLLVQEKQPKAYGLWNLSAGHVDEGESLEQAAVREAKEEVGFDIELIDHLLTMHSSIDRPVLHAYSCKLIGGELAFPPDEILDAQWFSYDDIIAMKDTLRNPDYIIGAIEATRS